MGSLRWILLLAGLVFIAAVAAWELRRPRQGRGEEPPGSERADPPLGSVEEDSRMAPKPAVRQRPVPPHRIDLPPLDPEDDGVDGAPPPAADPDPDAVESVGPVSVVGTATSADFTAAAPAPPLVVRWPPDLERVVIALRIVAPEEEPLQGRTVRMALGACGFVHGQFQIFHQPAGDGRALLSAASLRQPGTLEPATMDFQRLSGLSLFAVLPGPLPPVATLEQLLGTARDLARRLRGQLQDERGEPLDAACLERLRLQVEALPQAQSQAEPAA